jgi:hypothetical protein
MHLPRLRSMPAIGLAVATMIGWLLGLDHEHRR